MAPISKSRYSSRSQFLFYLLSGETTQLWLLCQKKPPKLKQGSCVSIWNIATLDPKNLPPSNPPIPCIPPLQLGPSIIWIKGQFLLDVDALCSKALINRMKASASRAGLIVHQSLWEGRGPLCELQLLVICIPSSLLSNIFIQGMSPLRELVQPNHFCQASQDIENNCIQLKWAIKESIKIFTPSLYCHNNAKP